MPYVGIGKVFDFLHATNDVLDDRGVELPLPGQSTTTTAEPHAERRAVQAEIVGEDSVDAALRGCAGRRAAHPALAVGQLLRRPLTRTGVDIPTRELLTFAMLVALGGCEPQVKGLVAANVNVGNDRARLIEVVTQLIPFIGYPRTLNGLRVLEEVRTA